MTNDEMRRSRQFLCETRPLVSSSLPFRHSFVIRIPAFVIGGSAHKNTPRLAAPVHETGL
jgi:hypothetical protein